MIKMDKVIGVLTLALLSTSANAIELNFSSTLNYGTGLLEKGDELSGAFSFDLANPDKIDGLLLDYTTNASGFVTTGDESISSNKVSLEFYDNTTDITQENIDALGFSNLIAPGSYDMVEIRGNGPLAIFSVDFALLALYADNTFEDAGYDHNNLFDYTPEFIGFQIGEQGSPAYGAGKADASLSSVPVPAAFWLFGSALAGLAVRTKKQA